LCRHLLILTVEGSSIRIGVQPSAPWLRNYISHPAISSMMAYYDTVRRTLIMILTLNLSVALLKGSYGLLTNSLSMSADGLHSLFDSSSNIIGLVGITLASRPPDEEHPYGHAKFETFASVSVAVLLFATCFLLIIQAADRFQNPLSPRVTQLSFTIMAVTLIINIAASTYENMLGKKLGSTILVADSLHTRSDIFASAGVILGFVAVKMGYPLADPAIALFICLLIALTGLQIMRDSSKVLLDRAAIDKKMIADLARSVAGVGSCHDIRTRGPAGEVYVDLHIGVDPSLSIDEAHEVSNAVELVIKSSIEGVKDVLVHLEPWDEAARAENEKVSNIHQRMNRRG